MDPNEFLFGCRHLDRVLGRLIAANGREHVAEFCSDCGKRAGTFLALASVAEPARYPVMKDNRDGTSCRKCGDDESGVEEHHWAPWALFGMESLEWPTAPLCVSCHQRWHRIVTPGMRRRAGDD